MTERGIRGIIKSAAALGLVAVIGTALLTGVQRLTADRIAEQERRVVREQLAQILSPDLYDNSPQDDAVTVYDETLFPRGQAVTAYRARLAGEAVAVILRFRAVDGYNGDIHLLAGIHSDGRLAGVRVVSHRETPGLGDGIEAEKSDWVLSFDGRSLADPAPEDWTVRRDGGEFDQFTGATVTPRAVVAAVRMALEYFEQNRSELFAVPAGENGT
jgi:electron transport complex protein RnfG